MSTSNSTNVSSMFVQLKSFCFNIEQDSKKLRKGIESNEKDKGNFYNDNADFEYINSLEKDLKQISGNLSKMENKLYGSDESRLSQVRINELLDRCTTLYESNELLVNTLESQMSKYGIEFFSKSDNRLSKFQSMKKNTKGVSFQSTIFNNETTEFDTIVENDRDNSNIVVNKVTCNEIDNSLIIDNSFVEINDDDEYFDEGFGNINGDDDDDDDENDDEEDDRENIEKNDEDGDDNDNDDGNNNNNNNNNNNSAFTSPNKIITSEILSTPDDVITSDFNAKTPTLADLKLSEATRNLVGVNGRDNNQRKQSFGGSKPSFIPVRNRFDESINEGYANDNELNEINNIHVGNISTYSVNESIAESNVTSSNIKGRKSLLHTPSNYKNTVYSSPILTPTTPTIGTPFQTCDLRLYNKDDLGDIGVMGNIDDIVDSPIEVKNHIANVHMSANKPIKHLSLSELNSSIKEMSSNPNSPLHIINEKIKNINVNNEENNSDEEDDNNNINDSDTSIDFTNNYLASPPKMAKILEPTQQRQTTITYSKDWIKLVTNQELSLAPVFIKKQINLELLNNALQGINSYLATVGSHNSEECLTQEQMDSLIIDAVGNGSSTKAILLCLLNLKRFDIGSNANVKVYKVKRL